MKEYIIKVNESDLTPSERACIKYYHLDELVRCNDCKNGRIDTTSYPNYWCSADSKYHKSDWFCADGRKKNE